MKGRLGYSYDSNVTLNPTDSINTSTAGSPFIGGSQKDGRVETVLDLSYATSEGDTTFGGGYNFTGFWQLGHGSATTDFTMLSHDLGIFAQQSYEGGDAISLAIDGVLTTLGRVPGADDTNPLGLRHELFNLQLIVELSGYHALTEETVVGLFGQYSRDFRQDDPLGTPTTTPQLPNGIYDANVFHGGVRAIHDLSDTLGVESQFSTSAALFWRANEHDANDPVLGPTAAAATSRAASFWGPRLRAAIDAEVVENVTLSTDIFYGFEYRYDSKDPTGISGATRSSNQADHRIYGNVKGQYDVTENFGVNLGYRWEVLVSNVVSAPPAVDPDYNRHVVSFNLVFQN